MRVIHTLEDGNPVLELNNGDFAITVDDGDYTGWLEVRRDEAIDLAHAILKWSDRHE